MASDLCQMLMQHTMNHHSYPVIHYFHNNQPKLAIMRAVVLLDESHRLLKYGMKQEAGLDELKMNMLQTALDSYLDMVKSSYLKNPSPKEAAPDPWFGKLEAKGLPLKDKGEIRETFAKELHERRKLLTALLEMDGWSWQDVYTQES